MGRATDRRAKAWLEEMLPLQETIGQDPMGALTEGLPYMAQEFGNAALAGLEGLYEGAGLTSFDSDAAANAVRARMADPYINLVDAPQSTGGQGVLGMAEWAGRPVEAATQAAAEGVFEATGSPAAATATTLAGGVFLPGRAKTNRGAGTSQRLAAQLAAEDITPKQFRDRMQRLGYLSDEEVGSLPKGREKAIATQLTDNPGMNANQLAEAALAGWPKRGWYRDSAKAIQDIFGEDSKRFAYLLSALSPQTSVESNLKNAVNTWTNWNKAGRPTDKESILRVMGDSVEGDKGVGSVLDAWRNNSFRALSAENMDDIKFSGPKVSSFARNLVGQLGEVTNDAWMAKAMDVNQDIFGGQTSKAAGTDAFGDIGGQGAGYQAANAVTREAADILTKRFADQGIQITPAEVQEMVWSYAKPLWEARDAEGNLRPMGDLVNEGVLTDDMIAGTPDFGTLLSQTPEYRSSLESLGYDFNQLSAMEPHAPRPAAPNTRRLGQFNERFENRYRRDTIPSEMGRTVNSILSGTPQFTDPGNLRRPSYTRGVGGRTIRPTDYRASRLESLGMDTSPFLQLEPGEAGGALFEDYMRQATQGHKFGDSVDIHPIEKYAASDLYLAPGGRGGFALDNGNLISAFSNKALGAKPGFADNLLLAGVNQGGRYLDAFDTVLPSMYSRAGFKPVSRLAFSDEVQQAEMPDWDFEKYGAFNEGRPDVMAMALDPRNAELLQPNTKLYDKGSKKAKAARQGLLATDYEDFLRMQQEEVNRLRQGALYSHY